MFTPGSKVSHASGDGDKRDIEAAAFSQLGKAEQLEAVREFVLGQDVFVSIPTGSGKSLCYR